MSQELRVEYLNAIRERYKNSSRGKKSVILDEFCAVCEYSRKYAIAVLAGKIDPCVKRPRGRKVVYSAGVVFHVVRLWKEMGFPGSTKFRAALGEWLDYDYHPLMQEDVGLRAKVQSISRAQIDRILRPHRIGPQFGISSTHPGPRKIKYQIPIQPKDWNITSPGQQVQSDTVAHCGDSLSGQFVNSLTVTDIFSGWTEVRAIWGKGSARVIESMSGIEMSMPFVIKGFKSDNGSEFLNHQVMQYFRENRGENEVQMTRSRPYKKNDQCYVEQKNYTHVRELFGYERFDAPELVSLMNEIYQDYWCPLQNFFMPSQKLLRKTRIGARIKKEYEDAKTPYRRLIESGQLSQEQTKVLAARKASHNPFELQKRINLKLREFEERLRKRNTGLIAA